MEGSPRMRATPRENGSTSNRTPDRSRRLSSVDREVAVVSSKWVRDAPTRRFELSLSLGMNSPSLYLFDRVLHTDAVSYTKVNYKDVEPKADGMYFLRDALECEQMGVTVVDCDPGWTGKEHDHADEGQEEVYVLLDGEATVTVEGEAVEMEPGDAIRISPDATHRIENGDTESRFLLMGAP
jgi:quercetin dioxygenase-like cupin family protein